MSIALEEFRLKAEARDRGAADRPWSVAEFKGRFAAAVVKTDPTEMEFDLIGVPAAFANAFRRLMLAEVPSVAVERVTVADNTSLLQDEVLAHRLGLVPLAADARLFDFPPPDGADGGERQRLEFSLKADGAECPEVRSSRIRWLPFGEQARVHTEASVGPVHPDVLLAKLRPGHALDLTMTAVKGVGADHAKFSPVATASYRLLPEVRLLRAVRGAEAELLRSCFSPGTIGIDETGAAFVRDARYDTCARNAFRHEGLADCALVTRVRDHFVFDVESAGAAAPDAIFLEAVGALRRKCRGLLEELAK